MYTIALGFIALGASVLARPMPHGAQIRAINEVSTAPLSLTPAEDSTVTENPVDSDVASTTIDFPSGTPIIPGSSATPTADDGNTSSGPWANYGWSWAYPEVPPKKV